MRLNETLVSPLGGAIDPEDFLRPIEFLRSDHERQRSFCEQLGVLVDDMHQPGRRETATSLLEFAIRDLSWSMEDEEELLAPALMRRCAPEDGPKAIVADLLRKHQSAATIAAQTVDGLDCLAAGFFPDRPLDFVISALQLTEILRRNLDWEDGVLLPLAALRLTEEDQKSLGSSMAQRRGMSLPSIH